MKKSTVAVLLSLLMITTGCGEESKQPGQTEPGQTEPGQTEPGQTEPGQTEPSQTEPGQTEPGQTEPGQTEPGQTEPGQTEPGQTEPGQTEPGQTEPGQNENTYHYKIDGISAESTKAIYNPDQGFYRPIKMTVTKDGITFSGKAVSELNKSWHIRSYENYLKYVDKPWNSDKASYEYTQLYHLRMDLSALSGAVNGSADEEVSEAALQDLDTVLKTFREKGLNVIIRFCYAPNFGSDADMEPSFEMMTHHIASLSTVLNRYPDVLTAIETGLVGPWGEMHTSAIAKDGHTIPDLMDAYLKATSASKIPILVRTPRHLYQYIYKHVQGHETAAYNLKLEDIASYQMTENEEGWRLGLFNDGYLGSPSDTGTYKDRASETAWVSHLTGHTPYGGEVIISDDQALYRLSTNEPFNTLDEMYSMNLSYLNIEWNNNIINEWNETTWSGDRDQEMYSHLTDFDYIKNHLGYRFVLKSAEITIREPNHDVQIQIGLENTGFGNLNRTKIATLLLISEQNDSEIKVGSIPFNGQSDLVIQSTQTVAPGKYALYLSIDDGEGHYPIQLANDDIWESSKNLNRIGMIEIPAL